MYINCDLFSQFFSAMLPLEVSEFGVLLEASLPNSIESIYIQYRWLIALVFQGNCLDSQSMRFPTQPAEHLSSKLLGRRQERAYVRQSNQTNNIQHY